MKVLTLHQPNAQLLVMGARHALTSPSRAPEDLVGDCLIICSSRRNPLESSVGANGWQIRDVEQATGILVTDLPLGCAVGVVRLEGTSPISFVRHGRAWLGGGGYVETDRWGSWERGRWVWAFEVVELYEAPWRLDGGYEEGRLWELADVLEAKHRASKMRVPLGARTIFKEDPYRNNDGGYV